MNAELLPIEEFDKLKSYVRQSCQNCKEEIPPDHTLYVSLVKHFFKAKNVRIDYKNQNVVADIPTGDGFYTTINFECLDLSTFLSSCIRKDFKSLNIYKKYIQQHELQGS